MIFNMTCPGDKGIYLSDDFAKTSWQSIASACQNGNVPSTWAIGDKKAISFQGYTTNVMIIGKNHDTYTAGGTAPLTFMMEQGIHNGMVMNSSRTNAGGWGSSTLRTSTLPTLLAALPTAISQNIKKVNKLTSAGSNSSSIVTTSDDLFLLSEMEVFGTANQSFAGEGSRYEYYANGGSTVNILMGYTAAGAVWLRSPRKSTTNGFLYITNAGAAAWNYADLTSIRPWFGFCF